MASEVGICNQALAHLGSRNFIAALTEGSNEAKQCAQHYDEARRSALEAVNWAFAGRRAALAESGETVAPWLFSYAPPSRLIRIRQIVPQHDGDDPVPYTRNVNEAGTVSHILCDIENAYIDYTFDVEATGLYPPGFVDLFAASLAQRIAMPITRNPKLLVLANNIYSSALGTAAESDLNAQQPAVSAPPASAYEKARQ